MIETPELDRQAEIIKSGKAMLIQEFYDWIKEQGWELAEPEPESIRGYYRPIFHQPEQLMADFFGIDRDKIEQERRALLASLRGE